MNPNEIPRNRVKDRVIIVKDGKWYEAVDAKPMTSMKQNHIWVDGFTMASGTLMAQLKITEINPPSCSDGPGERWTISRSLADGIVTPSNFEPFAEDISYPTKEAAVDACIAMIGDDMGVSSGNYDPDLWDGLQWPEHLREIRKALMGDGMYSYANLTWKVHRPA